MNASSTCRRMEIFKHIKSLDKTWKQFWFQMKWAGNKISWHLDNTFTKIFPKFPAFSIFWSVNIFMKTESIYLLCSSEEPINLVRFQTCCVINKCAGEVIHVQHNPFTNLSWTRNIYFSLNPAGQIIHIGFLVIYM